MSKKKEPEWRVLQQESVQKELDKKNFDDLLKKSVIKGKTKNQEKYIESIEKFIITLCAGPAGTGKTFIAVGKAVNLLIAGRIDKVIFSRPLIECDEELGFLPGGLDEKTLPFMMPLYDSAEKLIGKKTVNKWVEEGKLVVTPLAYMRGLTFDNSFVILDEAQNCTYKQLKMFLTRIGSNTRMVLCGDVSQSDIEENLKKNPFVEVMRLLKGNDNINRILLNRSDIVRSPLIQWIDERLS